MPPGLWVWPHKFVESRGLYTAHDSSWGTAVRPLGGYVIMYCNGAIDWSAKLITIVPDSSCEAETALASRAAKATCFFTRGLLSFHRRPVAAPTPMLGDNKAMYSLVTQEGASARTRYVRARNDAFQACNPHVTSHPVLDQHEVHDCGHVHQST